MLLAKSIRKFYSLPLILILAFTGLLSGCGSSSSSSDAAPAAPALVLSPSSSSFHLQSGTSGSFFKTVSIKTNNGGTPTYTIGDISDTDWLISVLPTGGLSAPGDIQIEVNPDGLGLASDVVHQKNVTFSADGYQSATLSVKLSIGLYDISVSNSPDRSSAVPLEGQTLSGANNYIFVGPNNDIKLVNFYYGPNTSGPIYRTEDEISFDFEATNEASADWDAFPFDTTDSTGNNGFRDVSNGEHTITAEIFHPDGSSEILTSTFTITN